MAKRIINTRVADIDEREVLRDEQFQAALSSLAREKHHLAVAEAILRDRAEES